jgi:hypothetical protein
MRKPAWFFAMPRQSLLVLLLLAATVLGARLLGSRADESVQSTAVNSLPVYPESESRSLHSMRFVNAPIIDGYLTEWPRIESIELNRNTCYYFSGRVDSLDDLSASIRSGWDEQSLYLAIQVTDNILIGGDSVDVWRDDSVELGLDGLYDQYPWGRDDHQYTLVVDGRMADRGVPTTSLMAKVQEVTGGYNIEVKIPVAELMAGTPISGTVMGFTVGLHDDDDGDNWDAYLIWEGPSTSSTPELFGTLLFTERPEDRLIALEARLIKLERRLQELLAILKEFEQVSPLQ